VGGAIASIGLASSFKLNTTVMPFILRGVSLLGIDSVNAEMTIRQRVWERLASDMKPQHINQIVSQIEFDELPTVFAKVMKSEMKGRAVVKIGS